MLYYDCKCCIDLAEGIGVAKSKNSKEYIVCRY